MRKVILKFSSLGDMLDFEKESNSYGHNQDYHQMTVSGYFNEPQIELAQASYKAIVIEDAE